jgi:AcrR family transcriptional regulator
MPPNARKTKRQTPPKPRAYRQDARAQQTEANAQGIVEATVALVRSVRRVSEITLDDVAERCGLTVRTILRKFGSRDGVLEAAFARLSEEIEGQRLEAPAGDLNTALDSLLAQYEVMGDLNIRALEEEDQLPQLHEMLNFGRASHRAWLGRIFGPHLKAPTPEERESTITALYAATDIYLWKLLRRDLGLDRDQTAATFRRLVAGVMKLERDASTGDKGDKII